MIEGPQTTITLSALEGEPLKHEKIRDMVIATANAIAERQGVVILRIDTTHQSITTRLATGKIEAMGFAAELRRLTTSWYRHKFGVDALWGTPPEDDSEAGEAWKHA